MGIETGFAVGVLILLLAFLYGVSQWRKRNRANEPITQAATKALYEDEDLYERQTEGEMRAKTRPS